MYESLPVSRAWVSEWALQGGVHFGHQALEQRILQLTGSSVARETNPLFTRTERQGSDKDCACDYEAVMGVGFSSFFTICNDRKNIHFLGNLKNEYECEVRVFRISRRFQGSHNNVYHNNSLKMGIQRRRNISTELIYRRIKNLLRLFL